MRFDRKHSVKLALTAAFIITAIISIIEPRNGVSAKPKQHLPNVLVFDKNSENESKRFTAYSGDYGEAPFDHEQHAAIDSCAVCHHTNSRKLTAALEEEVMKCAACHKAEDSICEIEGTSEKEHFKGKNAIRSEDAFHGKDSQLGCIGCHKERDKKPTSCKNCHTAEDAVNYIYKQNSNTTIVQQNFTGVIISAAPAKSGASGKKTAKCDNREKNELVAANAIITDEWTNIDANSPDAGVTDADSEGAIKREKSEDKVNTSSNGRFYGEWININKDTRGITRLVISKNESGVMVEAWGKCHPNDCPWGKAEVKLYGNSVDDKSSNYGLAFWDQGFSKNNMILKFNGEQLDVEVFAEFKDGSGRSNYRNSEVMRRADRLSLDLISDPFNTGYGYPGKPIDIINNGRSGYRGCSGQTFIAKHPLISSVDVLLMNIVRMNNKPQSPDKITMKIWSEDGRILISQSKTVDVGFGGWLGFNIPQNGLKVDPGRKLIVTLEDTGKGVFGWMRTVDNYAYGSLVKNIENPQYDFVFRINSSMRESSSVSKEKAMNTTSLNSKSASFDLFQNDDFDQAAKTAKEKRKIMMIDFFAVWCGPCRMLDQITWNNAKVREWLSQKTVAIKIDAEKNRSLSERYGINAYPTVVFLDPDGIEIKRLIGFRNPAQFLTDVQNVKGR